LAILPLWARRTKSLDALLPVLYLRGIWREFLGLLAGNAIAWPLDASAQQVPVPLIGFMSSRSSAESAYLVAAFRKGLSEEDYIEGRNVAIEFRWANGRYDQLPALAADLIQQRIAVLAALGGKPSALAAKAATSTDIRPLLYDGRHGQQTRLAQDRFRAA
jgi:ABC-type uncharacterized transport system substrate-binding protein